MDRGIPIYFVCWEGYNYMGGHTFVSLRTSVKYFECKQIKFSLLTKFLKGILELRD